MKTLFLSKWLWLLALLPLLVTESQAQRWNGQNNANQANRVWRNGAAHLGLQLPNSNNPRLYVTNGHVLFDDQNMNQAPGTGAGAWPVVPVTGGSTRLMWMPNFGALRFGTVNGTQWDHTGANLIGNESFAGGVNSNATGNQAFAFGTTCVAAGTQSFALGLNSTATGNQSFAFGNFAQATNVFAFAAGDFVSATGDRSVALGRNTIASNGSAFAMGFNADAEGFVSTAIGLDVEADGDHSFALGRNVSTNNRHGAFVFGDQSNTLVANVFNATLDDQFSGRFDGGYRFYTDANTTDAQGVFFESGGDVGLGVANPDEKLDVDGRIQMTANTATDNPANGTLRFNGNNFEGRVNGAWVRLDSLGGGGGGSGDDLGNHTATQNIELGSHWLTDDGSQDRGVAIDNTGQVLVTNNTNFTSATADLHVDGSVRLSDLPASTTNTDALVADGNGNVSTRSLNNEAFAGNGLADNLNVNNTVARWDDANSQFVNGSLTDDGTTVSTAAAVSVSGATTLSGGATLSGGINTTGNVTIDANAATLTVSNLPVDPNDDELTLMMIEDGTDRVVTRELANIEVDPEVDDQNLSNGDIPHWNGSALTGGNIYEINSNIGIGNATPNALLHVSGGSVLADGTNGATPTSGQGPRMMWVPSLSAFRAGQIDPNGTTQEWDAVNIGQNSAAFNLNTTASGADAFAAGNTTTAAGNASAAFGTSTNAGTQDDFATGNGTTANGGASVAMGNGTNANGANSVATGSGTYAMAPNAVSSGQSTFAHGVNSLTAGQTTYAGPLTMMGAMPAPPLGLPGSLGAGFLPPATPRQIAPSLVGIPIPTPRVNQLAAGQGTVASGQAATAVNFYNHATGDFSFACNEVNLASGLASFASGHFTISTNFASASFNDSTNATGPASSSFGTSTTAGGLSSMATGNNTNAGGTNAVTMGSQTNASGLNALATGSGSTASGTNATAFGQGTSAGGNNTVAQGQFTSATANNSYIHGLGTSAGAPMVNNIANSYMVGFQGNGATPTFFVGPTTTPASPTFPEGVGIGTNLPTRSLHVVGDAFKTQGGTQWATTSDARLKNEKGEIRNGLDIIRQLRPVTYTYNEVRTEKFGEDPGLKYGFMAQELKQVIPEFVEVDAEGTHWYNPSGFEAIFTSALQEQQAVIDSTEEENDRLQHQLFAVQDELSAQATKVEMLEQQLADQQVSLENQLADLRLMLADVCNNGCEGVNGSSSTSTAAGSELEEQSELYQNSPNPFRENTMIRYRLAPGVGQATLYIYDLTGTQLQAFELPLVEGKSSLEVSGNMLESGQYLYTLVVDGAEVATRKMVLTE